MQHPQYRVVCPECSNSGLLNRGQIKETGFWFWKQTKVVKNSGIAKCWKCHSDFEYDIDNNQNCYPTAVGVYPNFGGSG